MVPRLGVLPAASAHLTPTPETQVLSSELCAGAAAVRAPRLPAGTTPGQAWQVGRVLSAAAPEAEEQV